MDIKALKSFYAQLEEATTTKNYFEIYSAAQSRLYNNRFKYLFAVSYSNFLNKTLCVDATFITSRLSKLRKGFKTRMPKMISKNKVAKARQEAVRRLKGTPKKSKSKKITLANSKTSTGGNSHFTTSKSSVWSVKKK